MPTFDREYDARWLAAMRPYWHVVARSTDVAVGAVVQIKLLGQRLALWRDATGALGLVADQCPHRGVALSFGDVTADGCLRCPYHSWTFDASGACTTIPQLGDRVLPGAHVTSYRVAEAYGLVWACLVAAGEERRGMPTVDCLDEGTHWFWMGEPLVWAAQNLRQVENFCDVAHFSVLHLDTFGNPAGEVLQPGPVERDGWTIRFRFDYPVTDPTMPPGPDKPSFPGLFDYHVELPCTVLLGGASGPGSVMVIHSTPVDVDETLLFWGCAFPNGMEIDSEQYAAIEDAIWSPDRRIVQSQLPVGLPVDITSELHLPHDRFAISFRRALSELGVPAPRDVRSLGVVAPDSTEVAIHA